MPWPPSRLSPGRLSPGVAGWLAALASGALWGWAMGAIETLRQPPVDMPLAQLVQFLAAMMILWSATGLCWAVATRAAGQRLSALRMVSNWLLMSLSLSAIN